MSRKHFITLAENIARITDINARRLAAEAVASAANEHNNRFDYARFFAACGVV
jgi:hypothetical protein